MANILIGQPNYLQDELDPVVYSGGKWEPTSPLSNLSTDFFIENAQSIDALESSTFMHIDLGFTRDLNLAAIAKSNADRQTNIRIRAAGLDAWSGLTVDGPNIVGTDSIGITASDQTRIRIGDGFTISGDNQPYQATADLNLGENLITHSEDMTDVIWQKNDVTITADDTEAPDDTDTADKLVETATVAEHNMVQNFTTIAGKTYKPYIFVKAAEKTRVHVVTGSLGNFISQGVDLVDGSLFDSDKAGATNSVNAEVTEISRGFYKIVVPFVADIATSNLEVYIDGASSGASVFSYLGVVGEGVHVWGGFAAEGSSTKAYIRTESTTGQASGILELERTDDVTTGIAVATVGAETVECHVGNYLDALPAFDSGIQEYITATIPVGGLPWGSPGVWDGKVSDSLVQALGFSIPFIQVLNPVVIAKHIKIEFFSETNADGFVSVDAIYLTPGFVPKRNADFGLNLGLRSNTTAEESAGGVESFDKETSTRTMTFQLSNMDINDAFVGIFDSQRLLDISESGFVVLDSDEELMLTRWSFPFTYESLSAIEFTSFESKRAGIRLKEKLG